MDLKAWTDFSCEKKVNVLLKIMTLFDFNFTQSAVPASRITFIFVIFHQLKNRNSLKRLKFQWSFNLTVTANEVKVMDERRMTFLLYFSAISFVMVWCLTWKLFSDGKKFLDKISLQQWHNSNYSYDQCDDECRKYSSVYQCQHVCVPPQKKLGNSTLVFDESIKQWCNVLV